jgi:hypothetical protein
MIKKEESGRPCIEKFDKLKNLSRKFKENVDGGVNLRLYLPEFLFFIFFQPP